MQSQRSTRTTLHALLPDTAQLGTWNCLSLLPEATWRTLPCSSQPDSFWETQLRCVPWVRVSLPAIPPQQRRLRWEDGDSCTISVLKGCCQTHWETCTQAGPVLQSFSQHTKTRYLQKLNLPNIISFKQIFLVEPWQGTGTFAAVVKISILCCTLAHFLCFWLSGFSPWQDKNLQTLLCPKSTSTKTPKKSRGMFGGRLWTCIYSLELQYSLSRKNCWELRKSGILYNGLNSWWFQSSQKASQEGPDFAAWSISVPKGHGGMENRDTVFMVNWILLFNLWRAWGLFELWMMAPVPALCVTYSSIDRVHTLSSVKNPHIAQSCWHPQCIIKIIWDLAFLSLAQLQPRKGPSKSLCP